MNNLTDLLSYLYSKYLNNSDPLPVIEKSPTGKKSDMIYIDHLVIKSIQKSLKDYNILFTLGDTNIGQKINDLTTILGSYINNSICSEEELKEFKKEYNIDISEINNLTFQLVNNYMRGIK